MSVRLDARSTSSDLRPNLLGRGLFLALPVLAALGALVSIGGPLLGFRVAAAAFAVTVLVERKWSPPSSLRSTVGILLWLWPLSIVLHTLLRPTPATAGPEIAAILGGLPVLFACAWSRHVKAFAALTPMAWLLAFVPTAAVALWELFTGNHLTNYLANNEARAVLEGAPASTFGNPNLYAYFLCFTFPILLLGVRGAAFRRTVFGVAAMSAVLLVVPTGSQLGMVAICLEAVVWIACSPSTLRRRYLAFAAGCGAVAAVWAPQQIMASFQRIVTFILPTGGVGELASTLSAGATTSGGTRINLSLSGLRLAWESSLLGLGPNGFADAVVSGAYSLNDTGRIINPHNGWTEILAQYGVSIFIPVLVLITICGKRAIRRLSSRAPNREVAAALLAIVVVSPLTWQMNSSFLTPSTTWAALGSMLLLAGSIQRMENQAQ